MLFSARMVLHVLRALVEFEAYFVLWLIRPRFSSPCTTCSAEREDE